MLHPVCLLHRRGNQELLRPMLLLSVLRMDYASSVASQDTWPETVLRTRINWHFVLLAVAIF